VVTVPLKILTVSPPELLRPSALVVLPNVNELATCTIAPPKEELIAVVVFELVPAGIPGMLDAAAVPVSPPKITMALPG